MYGPCLCGVQEQWLHRVPDFLSLSVLCRHQEETSVMWRGHQDRGLDCFGDYKAFALDAWELVTHNSPLVEFSSFSRYLDRKLMLAGHRFQYFFTMSCQRETNQMSKTNLLFSASGSNLQRSGHPPFLLFLTTLLQIVSFSHRRWFCFHTTSNGGDDKRRWSLGTSSVKSHWAENRLLAF